MSTRKPGRELIVFGLTCATTLASAQSGLSVNDDRLAWPRWQTRVSVSLAAPEDNGLSGSAIGVRPALTARVLGDYYFSGVGFGNAQLAGGLRATSGLLLGGRVATWGVVGSPGSGQGIGFGSGPGAGVARGDDGASSAYLGLGYSGFSHRGGWGFSADIGLVANGGGGLRVGRALLNGQGLDAAMRELRPSPMLQVGASYSY